MRPSLRSYFILFNIVFFVALIVWGQETETETLAPIQVEDESEESLHVFEAEKVESKQAKDLEETFRETPEVAVGGSTRVAQKVYVRGLEDTNLNITIDGARQSGYLFHHQGRLNLDPELLKKVEVEAGTGNALSGPGALGGAIRFVTKDAEDLLFPGQTIGALVKGRYHSNNNEQGTSFAAFTKPNETWSGLIYGTLSESADSEAGGGDTIPYTASRPRSLLVKINSQLSYAHKLTVGSNFNSDNAQRLVRTNIGYAPTQPTTDKVFETLNTTVAYDFTPGNPLINVHAEAYEAQNKLQHTAATQSTAKFKSHGLLIQNKMNLSSQKITVGLDYNQDDTEAYNATRSGDELGVIGGFLVQAKNQLSESWQMDLGGRYDDYKLTSIDGTTFKASRVNPNAGLRYRWNSAVITRLGWAQAFRGPVPVEAFLLANATSVAPANNLKGTVAETTELATTIKNENSVVEVIGFKTEVRDPLESNIASGVVTRNNVDGTLKTQGYQVNYKQLFQDIELMSYFSSTKTEFKDLPLGYSGNGTRGVSLGDRIGFNILWTDVRNKLQYGLTNQFVMKLTDVPSGRAPQPGYNIHDISVVWTPTERMRAGLAVHNLFDQRYIAQGSTYANNAGQENFLYEPGQDIRLSTSYQF